MSRACRILVAQAGPRPADQSRSMPMPRCRKRRGRSSAGLARAAPAPRPRRCDGRRGRRPDRRTPRRSSSRGWRGSSSCRRRAALQCWPGRCGEITAVAASPKCRFMAPTEATANEGLQRSEGGPGAGNKLRADGPWLDLIQAFRGSSRFRVGSWVGGSSRPA